MLQLPLVLCIVLTELSVGCFIVLFTLDWRNTVKRNFLVTYGIIYLLGAALSYWFATAFSDPLLLNINKHLDHAWTSYLLPPFLLCLLLMIPYNIFLWLDKKAGVDGTQAKDSKAEVDGAQAKEKMSVARLLRLISGGLATLAGLTTIFVLAMIYRPMAATNLGGLITVANFFAGALALGGVVTAMWLGHWYLVTPALSEKPLLFVTTLVLIGVLAQVLFAFTAGPSATYASNPTSITQLPSSMAPVTPTTTANATNPGIKPPGAPVITPLSEGAIGWLRILVGFVIPLALGGLAWKLIRDRSFQSATGMLYLVVVCVLAGEAIARGLFLTGLG